MTNLHLPWLSILLVWPVGVALLLAVVPKNGIKWLALLGAGVELTLTVQVIAVFNPQLATLQLVERYRWIELLNIQYELGIDGISVLFLPSCALLILLSMLAAWNAVNHAPRLHFALLLLLESVLMGIFCATDLILFFLCWELTLPCIFLLIGLWGIGPQRRGAALKYMLFMLLGSVPLLFAIITLAVDHATQAGISIPQGLSFSFPVLLATPLAEPLQPFVLLLLLLTFVISTPLVPFHTWLPTLSMEAPAQISALLLGLKLGLYGILRYAMTLAPSAAVQYCWLLGIVGAVTLLYGAVIALQQSNLRRLLAYASISHSGLVLIGITALNMPGIQGAVLQLLNFTVVTSSLMLLSGLLHQRLGSTDVLHLGGVVQTMPKLTGFYFIFIFATVALPGSGNFAAELLLLLSALTAHLSLGIVALVAAILTAGYSLGFARRAFLGPMRHNGVAALQDLCAREWLLLSLPVVCIVVIGLFPDLLLEYYKMTAEAWLAHLINQPLFNVTGE